MRLTQALHRAALVHRNGPGTSHDGRSRTWLELRSRVARLAQGLSQLGVARGDRVAVLAYNSDRYFEAMYAVPWAGAIVVPLNTRLSVAELEYQLADSGARVLLFDAAFAPQARQLAVGNPALTLVRLEDNGEGLSWEALGAANECQDAERGGDDIAGIFYTGGTTGRSKGVVLSHANLLHNVLNLSPYFQFGRDTRCLHASPMFHIADALSIFGVTLHCGHHFFEPKFDAAAVLNRIATDRLSFVALVPTMLKLLVDDPGIVKRDLTCLTRIFYGGSAMPEAVARRTLAALPQVKFHQGYGLTETSPTISHLGPEDHGFDDDRTGRMRSAGQPVATVDVSIRDSRGQSVAAGEIGEICVRGPTVMREYWGNAGATADAFFGDWFRTGDIGHFDADGYLFVVDRLKDMIISGGENIYSAEVENVLLQHSAVQECAVIGVPDERWGERVHAILRLREGMSASDDELLDHCRRTLARYKCPRSFERVSKALPLSGAGKILKSELKRQFIPA
jgi:acyl-CoA synthetase (AMP-forming)/AMP-acid ligase II